MTQKKSTLNPEYQKIFMNLIDFLGSVFNDPRFCAKFSSSYNETLHQYFVDLLRYEAYLEKKLNNKEKMSIYFQKMLQILCNRKADFVIVANVALDDIYIQLNLIKTYLLNIYKLNFKQELKIFDHSKIRSLLTNVKKSTKTTTTVATESVNDTAAGQNFDRERLTNAQQKMKSGAAFSTILQNLINEQRNKNIGNKSGAANTVGKNLLGIDDKFYPYHSKPKIIVWLKWVLYALCTFMLGFSVIMTFVSIFNGDFLNTFIFFISIYPLSKYYLIFKRDITNKKLLRNRYTFNFMMFASVSFTVILLGLIAWSTFDFNFSAVISTHSDYSVLAFIYGVVAMCTWVVALFTYIFNPKIDRVKLKKVQDDLFSSITKNFTNKK